MHEDKLKEHKAGDCHCRSTNQCLLAVQTFEKWGLLQSWKWEQNNFTKRMLHLICLILGLKILYFRGILHPIGLGRLYGWQKEETTGDEIEQHIREPRESKPWWPVIKKENGKTVDIQICRDVSLHQKSSLLNKMMKPFTELALQHLKWFKWFSSSWWNSLLSPAWRVIDFAFQTQMTAELPPINKVSVSEALLARKGLRLMRFH